HRVLHSFPTRRSSDLEIIDLDVHIIDPRYKELFEEKGETSKEIILATNCVAGLYGNPQNQLNYHPEVFGGYQEDNVFQGLVDALDRKSTRLNSSHVKI